MTLTPSSALPPPFRKSFIILKPIENLSFYLAEVCPCNDLRERSRVHHEVEQLPTARQFEHQNNYFLLKTVLLCVGKIL